MGYADTLRPVLRLNEQRRPDVKVLLFLMRVTVDHEIDSRNFTRYSGGHVFVRHSSCDGVVAGRLVQSGMNADDDYIGAGSTSLRHRCPYGWNDVAEIEFPLDVLRVPDHHARRRRANNPDFHPG